MKFSEIKLTTEYMKLTELAELANIPIYFSIREYLVRNDLTKNQISFLLDSFNLYEIDVSGCKYETFKRSRTTETNANKEYIL